MATAEATLSSFDHENAFYLSAQPIKVLAQYELFKMALDVPGAIVECGVFKGASFVRLAMLRELLGNAFAKPLIGFDTFTTYATNAYMPRDSELRQNVVRDAGDKCIGVDELMGVLRLKGCDKNAILIPGDVVETLPQYLAARPELRISFVNLDLDFYAGSVVALRELWPRMATGGVFMLDDYGVFAGETAAIEEVLQGVRSRKFPFCYSPAYVVKE